MKKMLHLVFVFGALCILPELFEVINDLPHEF